MTNTFMNSYRHMVIKLMTHNKTSGSVLIFYESSKYLTGRRAVLMSSLIRTLFLQP